MSEEKPEKPSMLERIAKVLRVIGGPFSIGLYLVLITGIGIIFSGSTDLGETFSTLLEVSWFFLVAWLVCRAARYTLDDVISQRQKETLNRVARLGLVLHWAGSVAGVVFLVVGAVVLDDWRSPSGRAFELWIFGLGLYAAGRAARYVLKGD